MPAFIAGIPDEATRKECKKLLALFKELAQSFRQMKSDPRFSG